MYFKGRDTLFGHSLSLNLAVVIASSPGIRQLANLDPLLKLEVNAVGALALL